MNNNNFKNRISHTPSFEDQYCFGSELLVWNFE